MLHDPFQKGDKGYTGEALSEDMRKKAYTLCR